MTTYTHSPDPSKQYAILRKIRGSRDQAIPGYFAPQEQIPWVRGCTWTMNNNMKFNITKCKELIIDFSKEKRSLQPLTVNGNPIKLVESEKVLGGRCPKLPKVKSSRRKYC